MYWTFSTRIFFFLLGYYIFLCIQSFLSPFSDTWFANNFAHSIDWVYIILNPSQNKSLEVDELSLSTFPLIYCASGLKSKFFFYLIPDSNDSLIIFPINFIDLFTHKSVIHFKFYMKVKVKWKSLSLVQLFVTPWTVAHQAPWNSPHKNSGVGCISFSRGSSQPKDQTQVTHIVGRLFTYWATSEY